MSPRMAFKYETLGNCQSCLPANDSIDDKYMYAYKHKNHNMNQTLTAHV